MTVDERLERFKAYFLKNGNRMGSDDLAALREYLDPLDAENFDSIYFTLTQEEQYLIDNDVSGDFDELTQYLIHNKALHRYWDAVSGRTGFDGETGQLVLSPESSLLELGVSFNLFCKTRSIGLYSIKQLRQVIEKNIPVFDAEELESLNLALKWFMDDKTARVEGM